MLLKEKTWTASSSPPAQNRLQNALEYSVKKKKAIFKKRKKKKKKKEEEEEEKERKITDGSIHLRPEKLN